MPSLIKYGGYLFTKFGNFDELLGETGARRMSPRFHVNYTNLTLKNGEYEVEGNTSRY